MTEPLEDRMTAAEQDIRAVTKMQGQTLAMLESVAEGLDRATAIADMPLGEWVRMGVRRGWILPPDDAGDGNRNPVWCYSHDPVPSTTDERALDIALDDDTLCLPVVRISREAIHLWEGHTE